MNKSDSKIYLYCIYNSSIEIDAAKSIGIENKQVFPIAYKDIYAAVCFFSGKGFNVKKDVLVHEKIIEEIMEFSDVLPMRFNTVLKSETAVQEMLKQNYQSFKDNFLRIENKIEYGLKVIWNSYSLKEKLINENSQLTAKKTQSDTPARNFIMEKYAKYKIDTMIEKEADRYINCINTSLAEYIKDKHIKKFQTENIFLNASYLVDKEDTEAFKQKIVAIKQNFNSNFKFLLTGPWPPYNFVKLSN